MCRKNLSIYGVHIPTKCIESMHFSSCPSPQNLFPQGERGGENWDLLYQTSVRKYEDDLKHQVIYVLYVLKCF